MAFAEELDNDLGVSLARARRLAQLKEKAKARKAKDVGEVSPAGWSLWVRGRDVTRPQPIKCVPMYWARWLENEEYIYIYLGVSRGSVGVHFFRCRGIRGFGSRLGWVPSCQCSLWML